MKELRVFFAENPKAALAFSGGVDSTYLLYAAKKHGCEVHAYFADTLFQPRAEVAEAKALASALEIPFTLLPLDVLAKEDVVANDAKRCYYCKREVFGAIAKAAHSDGFLLLLDGTNADDDEGDRPGMQATKELGVRSPLREAGLTKSAIRTLSKEANLETWSKPAYACLATRIPTNTPITAQMLKRIEGAEAFLMKGLGFSDLRVRVIGNAAKLQFPEDQLEEAFRKRSEIRAGLSAYFEEVMLDLRSR